MSRSIRKRLDGAARLEFGGILAPAFLPNCLVLLLKNLTSDRAFQELIKKPCNSLRDNI